MTDAVTTDRVDVGDHARRTFTDAEERRDLVAAFVRDGLRACRTPASGKAGQ